jgi:hypothetical protein
MKRKQSSGKASRFPEKQFNKYKECVKKSQSGNNATSYQRSFAQLLHPYLRAK